MRKRAEMIAEVTPNEFDKDITLNKTEQVVALKLEKLKTINAPVLFVWPDEDKWINKEMVDRFQKNMLTANKKLEVLTYHADHAFANPSNPKHNKEFADDAFTKSMKLMIDAFAK